GDWEKAKRIFSGAVKIAPAERLYFLDEACRDNADLRREVESLLVSFDDAESFMESPAVENVSGVFDVAHRKFETGKSFGHYEIKPENIMIRPDGFVKILDFGLAKLVEKKNIGFEASTVTQNETAKGVILGTVNYMSPEQAKGEKVDERTDIFSFGGLIY